MQALLLLLLLLEAGLSAVGYTTKLRITATNWYGVELVLMI